MNWHDALMEALRNGGLKELAETARLERRVENFAPKFDYKMAQAGEPREDEETS